MNTLKTINKIKLGIIVISIKFIFLYLSLLCTEAKIFADDWTNKKIMNGERLDSIIAPKFNYGGTTAYGYTDVNVDGVWVPTTAVQQNKMVMLQLYGDKVYEFPRKYKVLYRIDPRFSTPQVFVSQYNYTSRTYELINASELNSAMLGEKGGFGQTANALVSIFGKNTSILVNPGDVVNIELSNSIPINIPTFNLANGLSSMLAISTDTSNLLNKIIYFDSSIICKQYIGASNAYRCDNQNYSITSSNTFEGYNLLYGNIMDPSLIKDINNNLNDNTCPASTEGVPSETLCYHSKGDGVIISVSDQIIKNMNEKFISFNGSDFLRFVATNGGYLNFSTQYPIAGMFESFSPQEMSKWASFTSQDMETKYNALSHQVNFLHLGSYVFDISIGSGVPLNDPNVVNVEYHVGTTPSDSTVGTIMPLGRYARFDAEDSGTLWVRATSKNKNLSGVIKVSYTAYTGSADVSNALMNYLIKPITQSFRGLAAALYGGLTNQAKGLNDIAKFVMTLAVAFYGIKLIIASSEVKFYDLLKLVLKIIIIVAIFSSFGKNPDGSSYNSWNIFYDTFFSFFLNGSDQIIQALTGVTSSVSNIFGFIDPLLAIYTNSNLWAIIFIQLVNIQLGGTFLGIAAFVAIFRLLVSILNLVISYTMGVLSMSILISLTPFFIIFIMFEKTGGIFDGWISVLVKYFITPVISFLFLLLLNQITVSVLSEVLVTCSWDKIVDISVNFTIPFINWDISFDIPFLPGIYFYVPQYDDKVTFIKVATYTFLLVVYSNIVKNAMFYVNSIASQLSNSNAEDGAIAMTDKVTQASEKGLGKALNTAKSPFNAVGRGMQSLGAKAKSGILNSKLLGGKGNSTSKEDKAGDGMNKDDEKEDKAGDGMNKDDKKEDKAKTD